MIFSDWKNLAFSHPLKHFRVLWDKNKIDKKTDWKWKREKVLSIFRKIECFLTKRRKYFKRRLDLTGVVDNKELKHEFDWITNYILISQNKTWNFCWKEYLKRTLTTKHCQKCLKRLKEQEDTLNQRVGPFLIRFSHPFWVQEEVMDLTRVCFQK